MSSFLNGSLKLTIFGQSHAPAIGMTLEGLPAGFPIDFEALAAFLAGRVPGQSALTSARKEADVPEFLCGLVNGRTCGAPVTAIIRNTDARLSDYDALKNVPRPGHADLTAQLKFGGYQDAAGGGHFSGRLTAPLCVAGGICLQFLQTQGVSVFSRIVSIGGITDASEFSAPIKKAFPVVNDDAAAKMQQEILRAKTDGDSVGGVIECIAVGLPAGLGSPMFDGLENRISRVVFAVPAVKGIEFGSGFAGSTLHGSENNDAYFLKDGKIVTETNHCGGILGGISNGMPLVLRAAIKPTPSIAKPQKSVDLASETETTLEIQGRHDPCIVPRAVPCIEAAAAIALTDALLEAKETEGFAWS